MHPNVSVSRLKRWDAHSFTTAFSLIKEAFILNLELSQL